MQVNVDFPQNLGKLASVDDILFRGRGITRWMIVHDNKGPGVAFEHTTDYFARVNRRVVVRTFGMQLVLNEVVSPVQKQKADHLVLLCESETRR